MVPYYIWGNTPDDPTTPFERIFGAYTGPTDQYYQFSGDFMDQDFGFGNYFSYDRGYTLSGYTDLFDSSYGDFFMRRVYEK